MYAAEARILQGEKRDLVGEIKLGTEAVTTYTNPPIMALKNGLFEQPQVPKTLWHYTDANGLLGIINSGTIWATDIRFLNDAKEFVHFCEVAARRISERLSSSILEPGSASVIPLKTLTPEQAAKLREEWSAVYERISAQLEKKQNNYVCVASFSAARDLLSQWRAYCPSGGYCIGFNGGVLGRLAMSGRKVSDNIYLNVVRYISEKAPRVIDEFIDTIAVLQACDPTPGELPGILAAAHVKNDHFAEEKEWRVTSILPPAMASLLLFRKGRSSLTPYSLLNLRELRAHFIDEIIIGPGRNAELDLAALKSSRASSKMQFKVTGSGIPYRNW